MEAASFHNIVKRLTDNQTPRVWSLLVTIFGELAQDEGAQISGLLMRQIRELIGIKPEAVRVALHRLRKDGWIENERTGRTSAHFLTDWGRAQSVAASPRIYAFGPSTSQAWLVVCDPSQPHSPIKANGIWLSSNLFITGDPLSDEGAFITALHANTPLPTWITRKTCDEKIVAQAQAFSTTLKHVATDLQTLPTLSALEQTVLRILLVHAWRRIVLKAPDLPDFAYPAAWEGPQCRQQMAHLLGQYPKYGLVNLEQAIAV